MKTIDDMQTASEKIREVLIKMEQCVLRTEKMLERANLFDVDAIAWPGDGALDASNIRDALGWMRVADGDGSLCIAVWEGAAWRPWYDAPLHKQLATFPRLQELVIKINVAVQAYLVKATSCQTANPDLDTILEGTK